jgi:hypothetical protein
MKTVDLVLPSPLGRGVGEFMLLAFPGRAAADLGRGRRSGAPGALRRRPVER